MNTVLQDIYWLNEQGGRRNLEDNLFPLPGKAVKTDRVFIVCDGVGGESKGEIASRIVCDIMGQELNRSKSASFNREMIRDACELAVKQMKTYVAEHPEAERMNTTLTLVCMQADGAWVAWCGDSRVYQIRAGNIVWRTKDHSIVEQLVSRGEITEEEALRHPQKNIILRSIGINSDASMVDITFLDDLRPGDHLLLCTDGLLEKNGPAQFKEILSPGQVRKDKDAFFASNSRDCTHDNFSMYLLCVPGKKGVLKKSRNVYLLLASAILIILFLLWRVFLSSLHSPESKPALQKNTNRPADHSGRVPVRTVPELKKPEK